MDNLANFIALDLLDKLTKENIEDWFKLTSPYLPNFLEQRGPPPMIIITRERQGQEPLTYAPLKEAEKKIEIVQPDSASFDPNDGSGSGHVHPVQALFDQIPKEYSAPPNAHPTQIIADFYAYLLNPNLTLSSHLADDVRNLLNG